MSGWPLSLTGRPIRSPLPGASGLSLRAHWRSNRNCCCLTRCWPVAEPVRNPRHRAGHPRSLRPPLDRDDRTCHAGRNEPRRACLRGRRKGDRRRSGRRRVPRGPVIHRGLSRPWRCGKLRRLMHTSPMLTVQTCTPVTAKPRCCAALDLAVNAGEVVAGAWVEWRWQVDAQPGDLRVLPRARAQGMVCFRARSCAPPTPCRAQFGGGQIFPNLSVRDNLDLGSYRRARARANRERVFAIFPRLFERRTQRAEYRAGSSRCSRDRPRSHGRTELVRALAFLLVEELFALVGRINADGVSVLVEQNVI